MKKVTLFLCMVALIFGVVSVASATVINFDDIVIVPYDSNNSNSGWTVLPTPYMGFTWEGFEVVSERLYQAPSTVWAANNTYGFPSAPNAAYNGDGGDITLVSGSPFNFAGAYFSAWTQNDQIQSFSSTSITVKGYRDGELVGHPGRHSCLGPLVGIQSQAEGNSAAGQPHHRFSRRVHFHDRWTGGRPCPGSASAGTAHTDGLCPVVSPRSRDPPTGAARAASPHHGRQSLSTGRFPRRLSTSWRRCTGPPRRRPGSS